MSKAIVQTLTKYGTQLYKYLSPCNAWTIKEAVKRECTLSDCDKGVTYAINSTKKLLKFALSNKVNKEEF